jgi:hypothetical protein
MRRGGAAAAQTSMMPGTFGGEVGGCGLPVGASAMARATLFGEVQGGPPLHMAAGMRLEGSRALFSTAGPRFIRRQGRAAQAGVLVRLPEPV